jgi:ubiquinone/menaquinone biosynthesis C-methylase UbiE
MNADKLIDSDWHATAFDALYPVVYAHRSLEAAVSEAEFAKEQLNLSANDTVLDLCCGTGRHMVHLQECCGKVLGLDFSADLLDIGVKEYNLAGHLLRGDMRSLPLAAQSLDALMNFFTSFGYFVEEQDNLAVLHEISRVLKPNARFMLDYFNVAHVIQNLVPESEKMDGEFRIVEKRWIDTASNRVNKNTDIYRDNELVTQAGESVKLYTLEELIAMLNASGLVADRFYGDFSGVDVSDEHPRVIIIGHKE